MVIAGTLPGVFTGYYLRVFYLPDPKTFKLFVGFVLLYIGIRLFNDIVKGNTGKSSGTKALDEKFKARAAEIKKQQGARVAPGRRSHQKDYCVLSKVEYEFWGERLLFHTLGMPWVPKRRNISRRQLYHPVHSMRIYHEEHEANLILS